MASGVSDSYQIEREAVERLHESRRQIDAELSKVIVGQKEVIDLLVSDGIRDAVKVLVGGAPTSESWAGEIGADGYAENAVEAVHVASALLS